MINYEQFQQIELRAATILAAKRVEGSEKLLRLRVSLGEGEPDRQILAGIGKRYTPEELVGKQIVIVANLEPRMLMGLESQGMLLAADSPDGPVLLAPDREVPSGAKIK
ncbi:MAG: methionine--tRNA ligase subunit beta [Candidatus Sungbacteria bacterium]|nr:methionine--tRNA ligase subunit beta [Candidatus Sungbacteria bacterium]